MSEENILETAISNLPMLKAEPFKVGGQNLLLVPERMKVVDLEKYGIAPSRKRGNVVLETVESLVQYVNRHKTEATQVYATMEPPSFVAVIDDHNFDAAGFGDHKAIYRAPVSKEWTIWKANNGKTMGQEAFALFIEQNVLDVHTPAAGQMLEIATSLKATIGAKFKSGQNLGNGSVSFGYEETVEGTAGREGKTAIPEEFTIGIPVFQGGPLFAITAKFRYRIAQGVLTMWYDLVRDHKVMEAAVKDLVAHIEAPATAEPVGDRPAVVGTGIKVLYGKPRGE